MAPTFSVKARLLAGVLLFLGCLLRAEEAPDAATILKTVRIAQAVQEQSVTGRLRSGARSQPFKMSASGGTVRWEFSDPPQTLLLRLGTGGATLEETGKNGSHQISGVRLNDKVRESDLSYEDLSMRFLYWPKAKVEGEQTMLLQKCWIVRVEPSSKNDSQYSAVKLWIAQNSGALLQAEALGPDGKLMRRFKVISGHSLGDGLWILKQMRIEAPATIGGRTEDRTPTYLEIDAPKE